MTIASHKTFEPGQTRESSDVLVNALAAAAMRRVADDLSRRTLQVRPELIARLEAATVGPSATECLDLIDVFVSEGVPREDIADFYIPEVARTLGAAWCEDTRGFAEVTIGSSRLQGMLRALGPEWRADDAHSANSDASTLVLLAPEVYHTLGAMVLAGQLRRTGLTVRLVLGAAEHDLETAMEQTDFDVVMVSASIGESLEGLRRLISLVRATARNAPPVLIGGTILEQDVDVGKITGADFATSDLSEALKYCGLTFSTQQEQET